MSAAWAEMREHRLVESVLTAAQLCGALQLRDLWVETAALAGAKEFTSAEIVAHAALPENRRLKAAIESACGADFGAAKVGKLLAKWANVDIAGIVITPIGAEANAVVWSAKVNPTFATGVRSATVVPLPSS